MQRQDARDQPYHDVALRRRGSPSTRLEQVSLLFHRGDSLLLDQRRPRIQHLVISEEKG
jgi:hypothetical protein